jgi:WD40 repeat protein
MLTKRRITRSGFKLILVLTLFVAMPSAHAQKYSDWAAPISLGPVINSAFSDQGPAISKDGLSLYFTSNRPGGLGGPFDMYVSQRASVDDAWGTPINLGPTVNSAFDEGNPAFSRDSHYLFFQSKRPGGFGGIDLWVSYREHTHDDFDWQLPVNLGAGVNSAADDNGPTNLENDEGGAAQLYFGSLRTGGPGLADIYVSEQLLDGSFGSATLVTELSTIANENRPSIRHDGREIFFQSNRAGGFGLGDLWFAARESTLDAWLPPVNMGSTINSPFTEQNAYLSSDRMTLFFSSDRPGGSGGLDLYVTTREKLRGQSGN